MTHRTAAGSLLPVASDEVDPDQGLTAWLAEY